MCYLHGLFLHRNYPWQRGVVHFLISLQKAPQSVLLLYLVLFFFLFFFVSSFPQKSRRARVASYINKASRLRENVKINSNIK